MATNISKRRFTVHEYHRMVDAGILHEDDRVELIRGEILEMSPIGPRHNAAILRANESLSRIFQARALVGVQGSIRLDEWDEPQPDLYLLRPKQDYYASGLAKPSDVFLIIEVADSSLDYDRTVKADLYAITKIPEYWIADVNNDRVLAYSDIQDNVYRTMREFKRGQSLAPHLLPACPIPIHVLLP